MSSSTLGRRPLAITTLSPALVGDARGAQLARHAAAAELHALRPGAVVHELPLGFVEIGDDRHDLRARLGRVAIVQPLDVGEQHQQRRPQQVRHQRRQPIVVAEADLQLVDRDRVVLVDDRQWRRSGTARSSVLRTLR